MNTPQADIHDRSAMETWRRNQRLDPQVIRRFRNLLLKKFETDERALEAMPAHAGLQLHPLRFHKRFESDLDGATRLLFSTDSGFLIETVILRVASGRTTVCVSSQVGCAAACDFCATGRMGIARDLTTAEILDQIVQAGQILFQEGRSLDNIVFMGMGEPLHNFDSVVAAIDCLVSPDLFARSAGSITVSTVGVPQLMVKMVDRFPVLRMALSLHSAKSETT